MKLKLTNIYNSGRRVWLFHRPNDRDLEIKEETSFFPYFYQPDKEGKFISIDGRKLKKIYVPRPSEVPEARDEESYEADIIYTKRFLLDRVSEIKKTNIKYFFVDIEVLADEFPDQNKAKYPISCITVYNSFTKKFETFYLGDYNSYNLESSEDGLINDFVEYIQKEKPDLLLGWNFVNFDYPYLYNRIKGFAELISPIGESRRGQEDTRYPAGISIVDYLSWFRKVAKGLRPYTLNHIAQVVLGKKKRKKVDFSKLNSGIRKKNREDVRWMVEIEKKYKLIPQQDWIRRFSKVEWEDFEWNSRIIDMLLLAEAKKRKIILPMKPKKKMEKKKKEFEGAYRKVYQTGRF